MSSKINLGIVGANFATNVHLPACRLNKNCHVAAISANNLEKTTLIAKKHNIPKVYKHWQEMLLDPNIDAIAIAVPPWIQPQIILAALKNNKAVFAEKPLAINLADAKKITNLAKKNNLANMINFSFAGSPAFIATKEILHNNYLYNPKDIRYININWQTETQTSLEKNSKHWKTKDHLGGGVLFNFASHVLFYLEWLLHPAYIKINSIIAKSSNLLGKSLGSNLLQLSAKLSNGSIINILISTAAFLGSGHKIEIYGDNASLILENTTKIMSGFTLKCGDRSDNSWKNIDINHKFKNFSNKAKVSKTNVSDERIIPTARLFDKFIDWVITGNSHNPNFQDGLRVNFLIDQIQQL